MKTLLFALVAVLLFSSVFNAQAERVALIRVQGSINPATAGYISRSVEVAAAEQVQCLILQLDTPGGLLDSTKEIVQSFYGSEVPVVVFVAPSGANATSAGCFITLASDVAAMAPNTSIGAAHPVSIGGGGEDKTGDVMKQKLENFTVSYIETIAEKRGRNVEWARASVRDSANITSETALATNVIDIIAADLPDLLKQLNGRRIRERTLKTAGAEVREIPMTASERVFQTLWRPEVLMILMLIAVYGIIGEISNPGGIIPGVAGVVALVLALYLSSALPVNVAGIALIVLAVALFIAEAFTPSIGVLAGGATIALFFGLLLLFDRDDPVFRLSLQSIIPATLVTSAFFIFIVIAGLRARSIKSGAGRETMTGMSATAIMPVTPEGGKVETGGEYWNARSTEFIPAGQTVEIVAMHGLTLTVKPKDPPPPQTFSDAGPV